MLVDIYYMLSTMDLGLKFSSNPNHSLEPYIRFSLSSDNDSPSSGVARFVMRIGDIRMPHIHPPLIFMRYLSVKQNPSVGILLLQGVVRSYGRLTERHTLADVPVKLRLRQLMRL
jgi:hypothetical protein